MEGPSLYLAQEQLQPFKGKTVLDASGNTKTDKERLVGRDVRDVFAWGKHLVFQFDDFALRIHFMLFGTFEATVEGVSLTGDYKRGRTPRLALEFDNGDIKMFSCSVRFEEEAALKKRYDFAVDIMSKKWDKEEVLWRASEKSGEEIGDVLLDQDIFAGVGNIIKNEVLSLARINPKTKVGAIPKKKLRELIETTRAFSKQFLAWRRKFVLRKHLKAYQKGTCPHCGGKMVRAKTGRRERWSYYCPVCQPITKK